MKSLLFVFLMITGLLFNGCRGNNDNERGEEVEKLFVQTTQLILSITDRLYEAKDSMEIDSLLLLYEKKIVDINFAVAPQTDIKLNEQENDSIYKLLENMRKIERDRLLEISRTYSDTIPDMTE